MPNEVAAILDAAGEHTPLVILVMAAAAMLEAAFGLGPFVPGETAVVAGAVALDHPGLQLIGRALWLLVPLALVAAVVVLIRHRRGRRERTPTTPHSAEVTP